MQAQAAVTTCFYLPRCSLQILFYALFKVISCIRIRLTPRIDNNNRQVPSFGTNSSQYHFVKNINGIRRQFRRGNQEKHHRNRFHPSHLLLLATTSFDLGYSRKERRADPSIGLEMEQVWGYYMFYRSVRHKNRSTALPGRYY